MRKIIFIAVLFVSYFGFSQGGPKMNVAKFVGELTTTERNSLDVPTGERWLIWNATTEQFEHAGSDDVWYEMGWDNLIDDHIVPDTPGAYDIGGQSDPFRSLVIEDVFINDAADSKWRFTLNSDDLVFYDYDGNWQERYRMNDSGTPTGPNDLINLGSLPDIPAVDASGFSGNLTTSDNTLQKIADALDGLGAASGVNTFENKITIKDDGVSGEDMYLDFKNYSGTLRANIWYSDGGLDRGLNIINATSNTVLTIPDAGDPRVNDIFRADGFKLTGGGSNTELLTSNGTTTSIIDDDTFATASSSTVPSSESVKAYVDAEISGSGSVPSDSGASDGDVLTTDGAGTYTWETPSGGGSSLPVSETQAIVHKDGDATATLGFDVSAAPSGERINLTVSDNIDLDAVAINASTVTLKENLSNKATTLDSPNDTKYPSTEAVAEAIGELNLLGEKDATVTRNAAIMDADGMVNVNSATDVTITIQANATTAFPVGTVLSYFQENTGDILIAYDGGVTGEAARTFGAGHKIVLWQTATDVWQVISRPATASVTSTEYSGLSVELQNNGTAYFIIP